MLTFATAFLKKYNVGPKYCTYNYQKLYKSGFVEQAKYLKDTTIRRKDIN